MEKSEKLDDFHRNPSYERRVVIFYDVLGWRSHIRATGDDAAGLGRLRRLILQHSRSLRLRQSLGIRISTFSDNVSITQKPSDQTPLLLTTLAFFQVAAAMKGFLLRGGITVGEIIHDDECVFGPGLNRAYELESKIAVFPRFIVDADAVEDLGNLGNLAVLEDDTLFIDPFRTQFMSYMKNQPHLLDKKMVIEAGLPARDGNPLPHIDSEQFLRTILMKLKPLIRGPLADKEWEKVAWLYDRIASQLGEARATSYPRLRPE